MKLLHSLAGHWHKFWFKQVSATGFGVMRALIGLCIFITYLCQWDSVTFYYSDKGMFPPNLVPQMLRHTYRFSLIDTLHSPMAVTILYVLLIIAALCVTVGLATRLSVIVLTILVFSFHEYGIILLDGGDTVTRLLLFILVFSRCDRAFSLDNLRRRYAYWRQHGVDQPKTARRMSIWPYRLLLWQMVCLYVSSAAEKWTGDMWRSGTAVGSALLLPDFSRLPMSMAPFLETISPILTYFTVIVQGLWILLIALPLLTWFWPQTRHVIDRIPAKRALLLSGVFLHGGIAVFMVVGMFSYVMISAYAGLLLDDDLDALRSFFTRGVTKKLVVLYDGHCRLCQRSIFGLTVLDWLHRLQFVDFHHARERNAHAPHISLNALQHAMHVKQLDGKFKKGYYAFRELTWHLPALWIIAPFLYVPGIDIIGNAVYKAVAKNRLECKDGQCRR